MISTIQLAYLLFILTYRLTKSESLSASVCDALDLEIYERAIPEEDATLIVERHNFYRKAIMKGNVPGQPKGKNLKLLVWDEELAKTAQKVAETCDFRHQTCVDRRWRYKVGQNLFRTEQPFYELHNGNWTRAVEHWFLEHRHYRYGPISSDYDKTGHYTQLIWDKTNYVGCGFVAFDNERDSINDITELYVCHYGPGGNHYYRYPYQLADKHDRNEDEDNEEDDDDDEGDDDDNEDDGHVDYKGYFYR